MPRGIHTPSAVARTATLTATRDKTTAPSLPIAEAIKAFNDSQDAEGYTQATQVSYFKVWSSWRAIYTRTTTLSTSAT